MRRDGQSMRRVRARSVATAGIVVASCLGGLSATPAEAADVHTGLGFDTCQAPSVGALSAWRSSSPFDAVGLYISGGLRACANSNLTPGYVDTVTRVQGWRVVPIHVGLQAPCTTFRLRMSDDPDEAYSQGVAEAAHSASVSAGLGLGPGTPIYNDQEPFNGDSACRDAVARYLSGWTDELHARGFVSGAYLNELNGLNHIVARIGQPGITPADAVWFANYNGRADVTSSVLGTSLWPNHQRLHQYRGGQHETFGGVTINIDRNYDDGPVYRHGMGSGPRPPVGRDLNDDRSGDLYLINGNVAGAAEAHVLSGASGFTTDLARARPIALDPLDPNRWRVAPGDFNGDRQTDLIFVAGDVAGAVEAHVLDGATNYTTALARIRPIGMSNPIAYPDWDVTSGDFNGDGRSDLYLIGRNIAGAAEAHILDGATNYTTPFLRQRPIGMANPIAHPDWEVTATDYNGDGRSDLVVVARDVAGAAEAHVLDATANFTTALTRTRPIAMDPLPHPDWAVTATDCNAEGRSCLVLIGRDVGGAAEAHVLDATTAFTTALARTRPIAMDALSPDWEIAP